MAEEEVPVAEAEVAVVEAEVVEAEATPIVEMTTVTSLTLTTPLGNTMMLSGQGFTHPKSMRSKWQDKDRTKPTATIVGSVQLNRQLPLLHRLLHN